MKKKNEQTRASTNQQCSKRASTSHQCLPRPAQPSSASHELAITQKRPPRASTIQHCPLRDETTRQCSPQASTIVTVPITSQRNASSDRNEPARPISARDELTRLSSANSGAPNGNGRLFPFGGLALSSLILQLLEFCRLKKGSFFNFLFQLCFSLAKCTFVLLVLVIMIQICLKNQVYSM